MVKIKGQKHSAELSDPFFLSASVGLSLENGASGVRAHRKLIEYVYHLHSSHSEMTGYILQLNASASPL